MKLVGPDLFFGLYLHSDWELLDYERSRSGHSITIKNLSPNLTYVDRVHYIASH